MCTFMQAQYKRIDLDKWYYGITIHNDPGQDFILDWIEKHAKEFREHWENSKCKTCNNNGICGYNVYDFCNNYRGD